MPSPKKPGESSTSNRPLQKDVFRVLLYAPNREAFAQLVRKRALDVGPVRARKDSKEIEVHLFLNQDQIALLQKEGWKLEVRENFSENGRLRQKEVGKGDRFEGGKVPPKGLGKKTGKEK
jgi:hypothetical protein